mmetsp:Transcript_16371/g.47987  ORF Transcript_16371/g.47987 Transcript_16371/m.47987 type:complete len:271 (+) Transcript_16371:299-1111(+)
MGSGVVSAHLCNLGSRAGDQVSSLSTPRVLALPRALRPRPFPPVHHRHLGQWLSPLFSLPDRLPRDKRRFPGPFRLPYPPPPPVLDHFEPGRQRDQHHVAYPLPSPQLHLHFPSRHIYLRMCRRVPHAWPPPGSDPLRWGPRGDVGRRCLRGPVHCEHEQLRRLFPGTDADLCGQQLAGHPLGQHYPGWTHALQAVHDRRLLLFLLCAHGLVRAEHLDSTGHRDLRRGQGSRGAGRVPAQAGGRPADRCSSVFRSWTTPGPEPGGVHAVR